MDDELRQRARQVLLGLLMLSEGKTQNIGRGVDGGDRDYTPNQEQSWFDYHRRQITRARNGEELRDAVALAETALAIQKGGAARDVVSVDWKRYVLEKCIGMSTGQVAEQEKCSRMTVWRLREAAGFRGSDGEPKEPV